MAASVLYSLIRLVLDVAATSRKEQTKLQAEVLVLRRQIQVLERQIKRVEWSPADRCTSEPNGEWVTQQARNLAWQLDEEGIELSILLHDRDRKFAASFDQVFESGGANVVLTRLMAPKANAHAER